MQCSPVIVLESWCNDSQIWYPRKFSRQTNSIDAHGAFDILDSPCQRNKELKFFGTRIYKINTSISISFIQKFSSFTIDNRLDIWIDNRTDNLQRESFLLHICHSEDTPIITHHQPIKYTYQKVDLGQSRLVWTWFHLLAGMVFPRILRWFDIVLVLRKPATFMLLTLTNNQ